MHRTKKLGFGDQIAFPVAAMVRECGLQGFFSRFDFGTDSQKVRFLRGGANDFEKRKWNRCFFPLVVSPAAPLRGRIYLEQGAVAKGVRRLETSLVDEVLHAQALQQDLAIGLVRLGKDALSGGRIRDRFRLCCSRRSEQAP